MSLKEAGLAALNKWLSDHKIDDGDFNEGAFRGVVPFKYNELEYVIKYDLNEDGSYEDAYGSCKQEMLYWERFSDTPHRVLLCPVLEFGSLDEETDWLIMPRLLQVKDFATKNDLDDYKEAFHKFTVPYVKTLFSKLTTDDWRIYLPKNLFGGDLHYNNWGYDPYSKRWLIQDYAGDDDEWDHEWAEEIEVLEEEDE